ncbi:hypothetical protein HID58_074673 [Brassica napus]|uniref:Uncharacterized protein n=1 Tax=Brassica napus TaxID=3708 RepID=A0ABQ7YHE9_BRANA|nr:hypothetical protein HID58_074673 [Brassica napus]
MPNVPCQKSRYNAETRQEATAKTSKLRGTSGILNAIRGPTRRPNESPLRLLQAQEVQARPA